MPFEIHVDGCQIKIKQFFTLLQNKFREKKTLERILHKLSKPKKYKTLVNNIKKYFAHFVDKVLFSKMSVVRSVSLGLSR